MKFMALKLFNSGLTGKGGNMNNCYSANDFKVGQQIKTTTNLIGIVKRVVSGRYVEVDFPDYPKYAIDKKVFIPAHGELFFYDPLETNIRIE